MGRGSGGGKRARPARGGGGPSATLPEPTLATMRALRNEAEAQLEESRSRLPRGGAIAVGGGGIDELARGEGLHSYLDELGQTNDPARALAAGKRTARQFLETFNRRRGRDFVIRRSVTSADSWIEARHQRILRTLG